ncbi:MAG: TonB-dependent receptor, partial [Muribaculaceae bacterium]|nr:TonB-dependent receptor [Muribaculaceae bacterium]
MEPVDEDGNFTNTPFYLNGPNLYGNELTYHVTGKNYGLNALVYLNVNILPCLTFRVNGAGKFASFNQRVFSEEYNFRAVQEQAYFESSAGTSQELTYNATLTFDKTFAGKWGVKAMIGTEATAYDAYSNYIRAIDFPVDMVGSINLSSNPDKTGTDSPGKGRALSFFGRVNLSYDNRYYLTANVRRDGSDRFGRNNRWGTFPSVNVMWRLGQEKFIKENLEWVTDAKIRGSYGVLGNDGIGQFLYTRAYVGDQILYAFNGQQVSGWSNFKVPNQDIKWEEVHQGDFGIDLSFLNNRLNVTYDYYNRQTKDMLYWKVVPFASGINYYHEGATNTMPINIGKVSNIGHEFAVSWQQRVGNDFHYNVGFNASFNRNKVVALGTEGAAPLTSADGINRTENGRAMSEFYGYRAIG